MEMRHEFMSRSSAKKQDDHQKSSTFATKHERFKILRNYTEREKSYTASRAESGFSSAEKQDDYQMRTSLAAIQEKNRMLQNSTEREKSYTGSWAELGSSSNKNQDGHQMRSFSAAKHERVRLLQNNTEREKSYTGSWAESSPSTAKKQNDQQTTCFFKAKYEGFRMLQNSTEKEKSFTGSYAEPCFEDHQLIGDSLLLRFSEQLLFYRCKTDQCNGARALGLCVSGQTVGELWRRIISKQYLISKKVILLIGTNDMLRDTNIDLMKRKLESVVKELMQFTEKIVVLTLPPVPKLSHKPAHWQRLEEYNTYIQGRDKYKIVEVADITSLFLIGPERCRTDCYELFYAGTRRPDRVHLNRKGLQKIHSFLLQKQLLTD